MRVSNAQRNRIAPAKLVLSAQGVDAQQYVDCVEKILAFAQPDDIVGLGGWCILGKQSQWLPTFWETIEEIIPRIARAGIHQIHIFGVTWWRLRYGASPLGSLLWLCDRYGISLSTDSRSPIANALGKDPQKKKRAGALHPYWRWNVAAVRTMLGTLRDRPEYQAPPSRSKQLSLF